MKASTAGGLLRSKETPKNTIAVDMESIPVFLRGGSILPRRERARRSSLQMQGDPFTLIVALNDSAAASGDISFPQLQGKMYTQTLQPTWTSRLEV